MINNDTTWVKTGSDDCDVTMGSFHFAQITDVVYIYLLDTLKRIRDAKNIDLFWGDALISIPNSNGPLISKLPKKIIRAFKCMGFKMEIY